MRESNGVRFGSAPVAGMVGSLAELGGDIANLAELQAQLVALDFKESLGRAVLPLAALGGGLLLLLACVPVALIGAAELLATALGLGHRGWAYLIVAGVALALALAIAAIGGLLLKRSLESFRSEDCHVRFDEPSNPEQRGIKGCSLIADESLVSVDVTAMQPDRSALCEPLGTYWYATVSTGMGRSRATAPPSGACSSAGTCAPRLPWCASMASSGSG